MLCPIVNFWGNDFQKSYLGQAILLSLVIIIISMMMPLLLVILLIANLVFTNILVNFPVDFFHLLGSLFWSILGISLLGIFSYFFGE